MLIDMLRRLVDYTGRSVLRLEPVNGLPYLSSAVARLVLPTHKSHGQIRPCYNDWSDAHSYGRRSNLGVQKSGVVSQNGQGTVSTRSEEWLLLT